MFKIQEGQILVYRVFDLGEEINLAEARQQLALVIKGDWAVKQTSNKPSIIIKNLPLVLQLSEEVINLEGYELKAQVIAKIWDYGACSISFSFLANKYDAKTLTDLYSKLESNVNIDKIALNQVEKIFESIKGSIKNPRIWSTVEDYTIFLSKSVVKQDDTQFNNLIEIASNQMAQLLAAEPKDTLSESKVKDILLTTKQYSVNDLAIIDWNSAFVVDPSGGKDICELIEFVLTHQLELRYYDKVIAKQQAHIYNLSSQQSFWRNLTNPFSRISQNASRLFIEISEMMSRIDTSVETVGDTYYKEIIDAANKEFNSEIRKSVEKNISDFKDESDKLHHLISGQQSNLLSFLITLLIVIDLAMSLFGGGH